MQQLLITINYRIRTSDAGTDYREPYMFYIVTIKDNTLKIGNRQFDMIELTEALKTTNTNLASFLSKAIMSDKELLTYCKRHRVGYVPITYKKVLDDYIPYATLNYKYEKAFVKKILAQKGTNS